MTAIKNHDEMAVVLCPTCQKEVIWNTLQKFRPFCSERCKLIDLGEWAANEKVIPGESIHVGTDDEGLLH